MKNAKLRNTNGCGKAMNSNPSSLREKLSRCIIENQCEDGSIVISDQAAMLDELVDAVIAALPGTDKSLSQMAYRYKVLKLLEQAKSTVEKEQ